jgi:hypothetical protein
MAEGGNVFDKCFTVPPPKTQEKSLLIYGAHALSQYGVGGGHCVRATTAMRQGCGCNATGMWMQCDGCTVAPLGTVPDAIISSAQRTQIPLAPFTALSRIQRWPELAKTRKRMGRSKVSRTSASAELGYSSVLTAEPTYVCLAHQGIVPKQYTKNGAKEILTSEESRTTTLKFQD